MKIVLYAFVNLILFLSFSAFTLADEGIATTGVRFRGYNNKYNIQGGIPRNGSFKILGYDGPWTLVEYNGVKGRVYSEYVKKTSSSTPSATVATSVIGQGVATAGVNFRQTANNGVKYSHGIPEGASFEILEESGSAANDNWVKVRYGQGNNQKVGYVYKQYVQEIEKVAPVPLPRPVRVAPAPLDRPAEVVVPVIEADMEAPIVTEQVMEPDYLPVNTVPNNLNADLPGVVTTDETPAILPEIPLNPASDPALIDNEGVMAVVPNLDDPNFSLNTSGGKTKANLNLRKSDGSIILTIPKDTPIAIFGKQREWLKVRYTDNAGEVHLGWVHNDYVDFSGDIPSITEAQAGVECEACENAPGNIEDLRAVANHISETTIVSEVQRACLMTRLFDSVKEIAANHPKYLINQNRRSSNYGKPVPQNQNGYCAQAVRKALNLSGLWAGGGLGDALYMVGPLEKDVGFKNLMDTQPDLTPETAPDGTILVYDKTRSSRCKSHRSTWGHVEIKESSQSYMSDFRSPVSIQKLYGVSCRKLIGVMVIDNLKKASPEARAACGL